jgi:hypothetical protein
MARVNEKPPFPSDARVRREAELAAALRANLKRRKAPPASASIGARRDEQEEVEGADPPLPPPTRDG